MHGSFDKFAGLQTLECAGGGGAVEHDFRRQGGLIGGSTSGQCGQKAVLQRREIKRGALFLKQCDVDLVQPPNQKPRPLFQRPGAIAPLYCFPVSARHGLALAAPF
jgi:hypothetical protein